MPELNQIKIQEPILEEGVDVASIKYKDEKKEEKRMNGVVKPKRQFTKPWSKQKKKKLKA